MAFSQSVFRHLHLHLHHRQRAARPPGEPHMTHTPHRSTRHAMAAPAQPGTRQRLHLLQLMGLTLVGAATATGVSLARAQNFPAQAEMGRVISSIPVLQQVAVPHQVCTQEQVVVPGQKSGAGAVMGGVAGGAIGNQIGGGSGRAVATMLGLVGGAVLGNSIEGGGAPQTQNVQRCTTQTVYENRTVGYNVTYDYAGKQYTVQMPQDPGPWVRLQVTPMAPAPGYAPPATSYPTPNPFTQPAPVYAPQSYGVPVQPSVTYVSPTVISSSTTFVPNTVYVRPYGVVAPPISTNIRLNWSNDRDQGHRGRDHWDRDGRDSRSGRFDRDDRFDRDGDHNRWR